eukprot:RCo005216
MTMLRLSLLRLPWPARGLRAGVGFLEQCIPLPPQGCPACRATLSSNARDLSNWDPPLPGEGPRAGILRPKSAGWRFYTGRRSPVTEDPNDESAPSDWWPPSQWEHFSKGAKEASSRGAKAVTRRLRSTGSATDAWQDSAPAELVTMRKERRKRAQNEQHSVEDGAEPLASYKPSPRRLLMPKQSSSGAAASGGSAGRRGDRGDRYVRAKEPVTEPPSPFGWDRGPPTLSELRPLPEGQQMLLEPSARKPSSAEASFRLSFQSAVEARAQAYTARATGARDPGPPVLCELPVLQDSDVPEPSPSEECEVDAEWEATPSADSAASNGSRAECAPQEMEDITNEHLSAEALADSKPTSPTSPGNSSLGAVPPEATITTARLPGRGTSDSAVGRNGSGNRQKRPNMHRLVAVEKQRREPAQSQYFSSQDAIEALAAFDFTPSPSPSPPPEQSSLTAAPAAGSGRRWEGPSIHELVAQEKERRLRAQNEPFSPPHATGASAAIDPKPSPPPSSSPSPKQSSLVTVTPSAAQASSGPEGSSSEEVTKLLAKLPALELGLQNLLGTLGQIRAELSTLAGVGAAPAAISTPTSQAFLNAAAVSHKKRGAQRARRRDRGDGKALPAAFRQRAGKASLQPPQHLLKLWKEAMPKPPKGSGGPGAGSE